MGAGQHVEVRAPARRMQICRRRRGTHAISRGDLVEADRLVFRSVYVVGNLEAELGTGTQVDAAERMQIARDVGDVERPIGAAVLVAAELMVLGLHEPGEDVAPSPAGIAAGGPVV